MKSIYKFDSAEKVHIIDTDYYLRFRSQNISNPVVLFLHGGCGAADRPFIMNWNSSLAEHCTMVCWDQRGAGLAYNRKTAKSEVLTTKQFRGTIALKRLKKGMIKKH